MELKDLQQKKNPHVQVNHIYLLLKFKGVCKKYGQIFKSATHSAVLSVWFGHHHRKHPVRPGKICWLCLYV